MFCLQCAQFRLASLRIVTTVTLTKFVNVSYLSQNKNINSVKQKLGWTKILSDMWLVSRKKFQCLFRVNMSVKYD